MPSKLPYKAKARTADNLFLQRKRAGYSQEALGRRAVSSDRISGIENGEVLGLFDTYVRLAGGLGITLDDLLAGVSWTPVIAEFEEEGGYEVPFEMEVPNHSDLDATTLYGAALQYYGATLGYHAHHQAPLHPHRHRQAEQAAR